MRQILEIVRGHVVPVHSVFSVNSVYVLKTTSFVRKINCERFDLTTKMNRTCLRGATTRQNWV